MALKDILLHVDHGKACRARMEMAVNLAAEHKAHLTGLYVVGLPNIPGYIKAQIGPETLAKQAEAARRGAEEAGAEFSELAGRAGIANEWRQVEGNLLENLCMHARYCDIAVVGQRDPEGNGNTADNDMPDRLILSIGRPVLVVPYVGTYPRIGQRVLVAWDASRLATRAVNDALPLLVGAKKVNVLAVNPRGGKDGHGEIASADICLHLARHGVKADAQHIYADDIEVGDMLLSRAADEGVDLIVMGAYGHARWRELVLGGATRHLLDHMTAPVLMSH